MLTEEAVRLVTQAGLDLVRNEPAWLDEACALLPTKQLDALKRWIAANPIPVYMAYAEGITAYPYVVVSPGEGEEADQFVGSFLGETYDETTGEAVRWEGSFFSSTHHVSVFTENADLCVAIQKLVLWALTVGRRTLEDTYGFREQRLIEGPLEVSEDQNERSGEYVFRRAVHLVHRWMMTHTTRTEAALVEQIAVTAETLPYTYSG